MLDFIAFLLLRFIIGFEKSLLKIATLAAKWDETNGKKFHLNWCIWNFIALNFL